MSPREIPSYLALAAVFTFVLGILVARGEEGRHGSGHEQLHDFYSSLTRPDIPSSDAPVSCCNEKDCTPTVSRTVDERYEIRVNGKWRVVNPANIVKKTAPDGGAHWCGSGDDTTEDPTVWCVVLPPEG